MLGVFMDDPPYSILQHSKAEVNTESHKVNKTKRAGAAGHKRWSRRDKQPSQKRTR
jgi:hypothetical protein